MREHKTRSYVTPLIREINGAPPMLLSGSKTVASYDPRTGKQIWVIDGPTEQFVASMVYNGQLLFMTAGFPDHHILAIRPDGRGNITDTHIAWRTTENTSYVPSPIVVGDYFLVVADNGIASCYEAATGRRLWKEAHRPSLQRFAGHRRWASLLHLGRRIDDRRKAGRKVRRRQLQRSRRTVLRLDGSRSWPDSAPRREASVLHRRRSDENRRRGAIGVSLSHSVCHAFTPQADWHAAFLGRPGHAYFAGGEKSMAPGRNGPTAGDRRCLNPRTRTRSCSGSTGRRSPGHAPPRNRPASAPRWRPARAVTPADRPGESAPGSVAAARTRSAKCSACRTNRALFNIAKACSAVSVVLRFGVSSDGSAQSRHSINGSGTLRTMKR